VNGAYGVVLVVGVVVFVKQSVYFIVVFLLYGGLLDLAIRFFFISPC
jgi:hypothetical protein